MNLLLIGAGQLGSRHLQACLKLKNKLNIYVVDNSENSLAISEDRANQIDMGAAHNVSYLKNLDLVEEKNFEYMIIATSASVRYVILAAALSRFKVRYTIFEKVLFQDIDSYSNAAEIINNNNITAFVNCPLRAYPFYKMLKSKYIKNSTPTTLKYHAGEWCGLACNAIHFIDLVNYLTDSEIDQVSVEELDTTISQSKRQGYIEFTGTLNVSFENGSYISMNSIKGSADNSVLEILNGNNKIIIDELTGKYCVFVDNVLVEKGQYDLVYQSNLTNIIVEQLEASGSCDLTDYRKSRKLHERFLKALLGHYNSINHNVDDVTILPIT